MEPIAEPVELPRDQGPLIAARRVRFPSAADKLVPPYDRDLRIAWRMLSTLVVVACSVCVLWVLNAPLLFWNTTPNGGDLGAHVWFPEYFRDHLLPNLRVAGWSNDWFGGFPAGQFYFPVPALVTVALDLFLPYNIALKVTTAIGPVLMPAGAYALGRGLRARRPAPELFAIATLLFEFFQGASGTGAEIESIRFNQRIMGGPMISALAGEYSFSFALMLSLFALGAVASAVRTRRRTALAAVLLAATVMSHVIVGLFAGVGAVLVIVAGLTRRHRRPTRVLATGAVIGVVSALLTAFWTIPLLASFGYTANMRYTKLTQYADYLIVDEWLWVYVLAVVGVALAIVFFDRAILTLAVLGGFFALVFVIWPELHAWNLRFLPFWYLCLYLVAAGGAAEIIRRGSIEVGRIFAGVPPALAESYDTSGVPERRVFRVVTSATIAVFVVVATIAGVWFGYAHRGILPYWAKWNETGYEHAARPPTDPQAKFPKAEKQWDEYRSVMQRMGELPPGRALWEGGSSIDDYGTSLAMMLLPYWTDGRIDSFEGLYYESAASTPYVFMTIAALSGSGNASNPVRGLDYPTLADFSAGVRMLRDLGGRYYLAHSTDAKAAADKDPGLRFIASVPDRDGKPPTGWNIYEVRAHALVAPLVNEPLVVPAVARKQNECFGRAPGASEEPRLGDWECVAAGWWRNAANLDRPLAESGPEEWKRAPTLSAAMQRPGRRLPTVRVSRIRETDNEISFRVSRVGVPIVVRSSYYPNWRARGADGPWRLTPNLMAVVPTERTVTLHFDRSGVEYLGIALTLIGLLALAGLVVVDLRRERDLGGKPPKSSPTPAGPGDGGTGDAPFPTRDDPHPTVTMAVPPRGR